TRAFQAVNREVIYFHGEMAEIPAQRLHFHAATGSILKNGDDSLPHLVGEMLGRSIEKQPGDDQNQQQQQRAPNSPEVAPDADGAGRRGWLGGGGRGGRQAA